MLGIIQRPAPGGEADDKAGLVMGAAGWFILLPGELSALADFQYWQVDERRLATGLLSFRNLDQRHYFAALLCTTKAFWLVKQKTWCHDHV